jgi:hypothetical protein
MQVVDRQIRLHIMIHPQELQAIEDWRFAKRMPSRASAVRELLFRGLAAEGFQMATIGKHSAEFGVTGNSRRKKNG